MKKAVVLFSGGLDSTTILHYAKSLGFSCYALTIHYGQRHVAELAAAQRITQSLKVPHEIMDIPLYRFGGSALVDSTIAVPDYHESSEIPVTYVPARNTIFLSLALGMAETIQAYDIFYGANAIDYSKYPDCRPEYYECFSQLAQLATKAGVNGEKFQVHAPLIHLKKSEIIALGLKLGIDYRETVSCYRANAQGHACGKCDSCAYRKTGVHELQVGDQTIYTSK